MVPLLSPDPERDFDELFLLLSEFLVKHGVPKGKDGLDVEVLDAALRERGWHWRVSDSRWDGPGDYHIAVGKPKPDQTEKAREPLDHQFDVRLPMSEVKARPAVGASQLALAIALEAVIRAAEAGIDNVMFVLEELIGLERSATGAPRGPIGPPSPLGELIGVVPIAQVSTVNQVRFTLRSLESYQRGFVVQFRLVLEPNHPRRQQDERAEELMRQEMAEARQRGTLEEFIHRRQESAHEPVFPRARIAAWDDRGNRYQTMPASGGGSRHDWKGECHFWPELDARAERLTIEARLGWSRVGGMARGEEDAETDSDSRFFDVDLTIGRRVSDSGDEG